MPEWVLAAALSAVGGAVGSYVAVRVEMAVLRTEHQWLRRDVDFLLTRAEADK